MRAPHRVRMNLEVTFEYMAEDMASLEREVREVVRNGYFNPDEVWKVSRNFRQMNFLVTRIESRRRKEFEYGKSRTTAKRS